MPPTPCPSRDELGAFLVGSLAVDRIEGLAEHLAQCAACTAELQSLPLDGDPWVVALRRPAADPFTTGPDCARVVARLETIVQEAAASARDTGGLEGGLVPTPDGADAHESTPPHGTGSLPAIPGYQVLGVLGRGGMGVVYQARDLSLPRVVALKMVLTGEQATPERRARFRAEAEALARLRHPHIVQVYAYGEHQGQPYFALEYVEGGSLDRKLGRQPQGPGAAARLVFLLARAVHAAHQAGLVHRDLKPSNVLLAPAADEAGLNSAYGWPKVTDFGVARCLDGPSDRTAEGAVLGTPSYMAPEQAAGKVKQVGPAADVYALGVILFEMLTGSLPFRGESRAEVLDKVRHEKPLPPRRLRSEIPEALEAICLKCLDKRPERRYLSAAGLAEALERFLQNQPGPELALPLWRRGRVLLAGAVLAATLVLVAVAATWWGGNPAASGPRAGERPKASDLGGHRADGKVPDRPPPKEADRLPPDEKAPRITRFQVRHYARQAQSPLVEPRGLLGEKAFAVRFNDQVRLEVELNRKAYLYLLAFNADGKEQLLWPTQGPPPALSRLKFPNDAGNGWTLDDEPQGGVQAFVVVASTDALPSYADWKKGRPPLSWQRLPVTGKEELVWCGNDQWLDEISPGGTRRGREEELGGVGTLFRLARTLRQAPGVADVSLLACPVWPKETR
jgi:serine/threonine protein kinase